MNSFKVSKYIQLALTILFDIAFFTILIVEPALRYAVFSNRYLLTLCIIMWAFSIVTLAFLVSDLHKILELEITHHELNKEAYLDDLTGIPNRHSLDSVFDEYESSDSISKLGCAIVKLSNLIEINNDLGRSSGDEAIRVFSDIFETAGESYGFVVRNGGNEYLAVIEDCTDSRMQEFIKGLKAAIEANNMNRENIQLEIEYAYVINSDIEADHMSDLIGAAYKKLGV